MDIAANGWGIILHVSQARGHGRGPSAVGQAHPQVEHDLGETTRSDIYSQTFHKAFEMKPRCNVNFVWNQRYDLTVLYFALIYRLGVMVIHGVNNKARMGVCVCV